LCISAPQRHEEPDDKEYILQDGVSAQAARSQTVTAPGNPWKKRARARQSAARWLLPLVAGCAEMKVWERIVASAHLQGTGALRVQELALPSCHGREHRFAVESGRKGVGLASACHARARAVVSGRDREILAAAARRHLAGADLGHRRPARDRRVRQLAWQCGASRDPQRLGDEWSAAVCRMRDACVRVRSCVVRALAPG
jgi:hypothetical protein